MINYLNHTEVYLYLDSAEDRVAQRMEWLCYGLVDRGSTFCWSKRFSLLQSVLTGSGTHPVSYSVGTGDSRLLK